MNSDEKKYKRTHLYLGDIVKAIKDNTLSEFDKEFGDEKKPFKDKKVIQLTPCIDLQGAMMIIDIPPKDRNNLIRKAIYNIPYDNLLEDLFQFLTANFGDHFMEIISEYWVQRKKTEFPEFNKFMEYLTNSQRVDYK